MPGKRFYRPGMDAAALWTFVVVDLLLVITPGADWAYVIATSLGDRPVVLPVAGLVSGYAVHTALVSAGLGLLVATEPVILTALTLVGAAYLLWLGGTILARPGAMTIGGAQTARPVLRGLAVSGLNPKGLLLFLALLPQFVRLDAPWPVAAQTATLGAVHMLNCAIGYLGVGLLARRLLRARPSAAETVTRAAGAGMLVVAVLLLVERLTVLT
jgi:threonine/homoserine/homoserine lactone efflux protein